MSYRLLAWRGPGADSDPAGPPALCLSLNKQMTHVSKMCERCAHAPVLSQRALTTDKQAPLPFLLTHVRCIYSPIRNYPWNTVSLNRSPFLFPHFDYTRGKTGNRKLIRPIKNDSIAKITGIEVVKRRILLISNPTLYMSYVRVVNMRAD